MEETQPYKENPYDGENMAMSDKSHKLVIRPNNYAILVPILKGNDSIILPISKTTGKGSKREYEYLGDVTIEKTSKSMIIYLKKRWVKTILKPEDAEEEDKKVKDFLAGKLLEFMQKYPTAQLDWPNTKLIRREIGIKDKRLRLAKDLRVKDDIFKKVYAKEVEFYNPAHLKNYMVNMSLKDLSPELADMMKMIIESNRDFAENLKLHIDVMNKISETLSQLQATIKPKESWFQRFIKKVWKHE